MIVGQIPSARDNPQISEGIRRSFPQMLNMMSDPSVMEAMRNPRVSEAFRQIQEGFSTLRREAPQLLNLFQAGAMGGGAFGSDANASSAGANSANGLADLFNSMNMGGGRPSSTAAPVNPEQTYASQLEQLQSMGFSDRARNVAALTATFGDLNAAVERLLNSP